ncbi:hypothetical protein [Singulisphaera acidiphila]|uniref:CdiI immunity protein domain-containing protein n=1 Tax=Singulisphaera acidiphila (strain ATCC BAA-1392 / DSM 18658 / VKM B-2454 / MOB10) TaxID=886293 RepID=L0DID3_SINAD|nr:hypothetical protein [Singulisphaera acidiphila]AGA28391.1 hypothetical protein Sinac_4184 [Singulisphaera acidiphila DSM 18658]
MGVNIRLVGSEMGPHFTEFCTNGGYSAFCDWLDSLPEDRFPSARVLSDEGEFKPTDVLAEQLEEAFEEMPPDDPDVLHVVDTFLSLIGIGYPNETVTIES